MGGLVNVPTIAIISQKGGAGKTTLAIHLAAAAEAVGRVALLIDTDPQATASTWAAWRKDQPPAVIDSAPPRLSAKIEQATQQGAQIIVIDTPPHADTAASRAVEVADLVLIPCRPSAFDLAAIQTTGRLVTMLRKPAFVVFTAGPPNAPRVYEEASEVVTGFGLVRCPVILPDRAVYRHASAEGKTAMEIDPSGRASSDIANVYKWVCEQVDVPTAKARRKAG